MNPVTERWLLIERLDNIVMWSVFVYLLIAFPLHFITRRYKWKNVNEVQHFVDGMVIVAVICYFYWKFFLAWKGIYY